MLRLNLKLTTVTGRRATARLQLSFILLDLQVCSSRPGGPSCNAMRLNYEKVWPVSCVISLRDDGHHTWRHHKVWQLPGMTGLAAWRLASFMMYAVRLHASRWSAIKGRAALSSVELTSCQGDNNCVKYDYRFQISKPVTGCKTGNHQTGNRLTTLVTKQECDTIRFLIDNISNNLD